MMRSLIFAWTAFAGVTIAMKLKLAQDVDYPPYAYKNSTTGELLGFGKDIADGMSAMCDDLEIEVVETAWSNCWSSAGGGTLGQGLENGDFDACMTYTHTQGIRNVYADFSYGILEVNKAAGLLTLLSKSGTPKVTGQDDLAGKKVVDVGGWAPTADGLGFVTNKCTGEKYSTNYTVLVGEGESPNDVSLRMLLDCEVDAMFVYADQAYNYQKKCQEGAQDAFNCSLWDGFGTKFAYVQTGQFGYTTNGTTLALAKKGSGVPEKLNPCLAEFMETKEYHDICKKHDLLDSCYRNAFFTADEGELHEYNKPTNEHQGDCSNGYCPCTEASETEKSFACDVNTNSAPDIISGAWRIHDFWEGLILCVVIMSFVMG